MDGILVAFVLAVFGAVVLQRCVIIVPADSAYVVERLGRYFQTLRPGLYLIIPFVDRVAFRYSLQPRDTPLDETGITRDNAPVRVTATVRWQIVDPQHAAYASANEAEFVAAIVRSGLRDAIARRSSNDVRESTRELQQEVVREAAESAGRAGVKILAVDVERIASAG